MHLTPKTLFVACLSLFLATAAAAQSPAGSFDELEQRLKRGQEVIVTDADGDRTKGRITEMSSAGFTLSVADGFDERSRSFAAGTVASVRKTDPVWNGLLLGLGAGLAATELWVYDQCGGRGSDRECEVIVSLVGWTALGIGGAVGGALIDKFHNKLVYRAGSTAVVKVTPRISPARQAVAVTLSF